MTPLATPRSALRILVGTITLNTVIALGLYAAGRTGSFLENFAQSQAIGLTIAAACWSVVPWVERAKGRLAVSLPLFGLAIGGGVALGMQLAVLATRLWFPDSPAPGQGLLSARTAILSLSIGIAGTLAFYGRELLKNERIRAESEGWRAMAAERSAAQAQLQALRAQVEPHFLFNTLANVSALIDRDPPAARALVDDLARHLRATLRHARADTTTLGEELDVTASLLSIMKRRIGDRLQWRFEVADALRGEAMAPMLVQPLVENAVKHGIEPAAAGGTIALRAHREADGALVIEVADTGRGLTSSAARPHDDGGGTGLANLADRLRAIYGPQAQVTLYENAPRGTIARLVLPARPAAALARSA